jgi:cysteine desulfurase / selenocysteine lyase
MAGWYSVKDLFSADRFETFTFKEGAARLALGMPNFPSIYALHRGLKYLLACGVEAINVSLAPLVQSVRQGFQERGFQLLTPSDNIYASGIISFNHPRCEEIGTELRRRGVIVWGGDGRIRASVHLYNDSSDVDQLFSALDSAEVQSLL